MKTGLASVKLSLAGFIIPYMFIYNSGLLLLDVSVVGAIIVAITSTLGVFLIGIAVEGYLFTNLNIVFRALALVGSIMLINANRVQDMIGLGILLFLIGIQYIRNKKLQN
ncbi:hypothetical protein [Fusobacterium perfoetens]|nr:hypothetical protein [Fusobacterium perfoetens]